MSATDKIAARLRDAVARRNAEARRDALTQILLGIVICVVSLGFVFAVFFMIGAWIRVAALPFMDQLIGLLCPDGKEGQTFRFAIVATSIFAIAATISAWFRVDPLRGLRPATDRDFMLGVLMSQAVGLSCDSARGTPRPDSRPSSSAGPRTFSKASAFGMLA